jgi:hypothetical protein
MENNHVAKMVYFDRYIKENLDLAFQRGDSKYKGMQHSHDPRILNRTAVEDINHIRTLHVDVRLREAEESADNGLLESALAKIESAIGYLIILHMRVNAKLQEGVKDD